MEQIDRTNLMAIHLIIKYNLITWHGVHPRQKENVKFNGASGGTQAPLCKVLYVRGDF